MSIHGLLFKMCLDHVMRRCLQEIDFYDILKACHDGPSARHYSIVRIVHNILGASYFWPMMIKDVAHYIMHCDQCYRMGRPTNSTKMQLQTQVSLEPFEKWGIAFVGPIDLP